MKDNLGNSGGEDTGRLCFRSQDDALNFARDSVQRGNDWLARQSISPLENYTKGRVHLILNVRSVPKAHEFDLVFRCVPLAVSEFARPINGTEVNAERLIDDRMSYWDNHAMRVGVPYTVQAPQQVIPSLVWLEPSQKRVDFRWIAAQSITLKFTDNANGIAGEGEAGIFRKSSFQGNSTAVNGMIKSVSQVTGGVLDDSADFLGQVSSEFDFMYLLSRLNINIDNTGEWITVNESAHPLTGIFNLIACVAD